MLPSETMPSIIPFLRGLCVALGIAAALVVIREWNNADVSRPAMSRGSSWLHGASGSMHGKG